MADKVVVVAIRPPRLDLFAPDMLEHTLKKQGKCNFIIHLGDATNIACKNEWTKFVTRMKPERFGKKVHEGWVMVPGNHDFFLGNSWTPLDEKRWLQSYKAMPVMIGFILQKFLKI